MPEVIAGSGVLLAERIVLQEDARDPKSSKLFQFSSWLDLKPLTIW